MLAMILDGPHRIPALLVIGSVLWSGLWLGEIELDLPANPPGPVVHDSCFLVGSKDRRGKPRWWTAQELVHKLLSRLGSGEFEDFNSRGLELGALQELSVKGR